MKNDLAKKADMTIARLGAAAGVGVTLEEIGELMALDRTDDRARVRELATERVAALDARIAELEQSRAALERLRSSCASGRKGPCPILEAFDMDGSDGR
jgi:MerR family mercuric resistance operon transcriptional regulator